jgi:transposase
MSNINTTSSSNFPESNKGMHYETRCGSLIKILWHDGIGMSLFSKRLERGRFIWPTPAASGVVSISASQLAYMLDGIDWRNPQQTFRPRSAG